MSDLNHLCYGCFHSANNDPCEFCGYRKDTPQHSASCLSPGTLLNGQYIIGKTLGQGGFGITYLGYDRNLDLIVAIKEYMPEGIVTRSFGTSPVSVYSGNKQETFDFGVTKFLEEARILARFTSNPHIVTVRTFFKENGTAYFVMDYVDGMSLKEYLREKGGRLSYGDTLSLMNPVMDALGSVHEKSLLHRDISPDNIYITRNGQVKLLDFGAARYTLNEHSKSLSVILKPGFAPEEQYRSRGNQGPWTDVYSLAATLYLMITGTLPPEALDRVHEDELILPSKFGAVIPEYAEKALIKGLEVLGKNRYQTMTEFKNALNGSPFIQNVNNSQETHTQAVIPQDIQPQEAQLLPIDETTETLEQTIAVSPSASPEPLGQTVAINPSASPEPLGQTVAVNSSASPEPLGQTVAIRPQVVHPQVVHPQVVHPQVVHPNTVPPPGGLKQKITIITASRIRTGIAIGAAAVLLIGVSILLSIGLRSKAAVNPHLDPQGQQSGVQSEILSGTTSGTGSSTGAGISGGNGSGNGSLSGSQSMAVSGSSGNAITKTESALSSGSSGTVSKSGTGTMGSSRSSSGPVSSITRSSGASSSLDSGTPANTVGNTGGNLVNGGLATIQGEWIYYADSTKISRIKTNSTGKQTILTVSNAYSLNVVGDWIYFVNGSDENTVYRIKTDGTGKKKLCGGYVNQIIATKDWVYYLELSYQKIHRMKPDGSSDTVVAEHAVNSMFALSGSDLYYADESELCHLVKTPANGSGPVTELTSNYVQFINISGQTVYYLDSANRPFRVGTDGSGQSAIRTEYMCTMNVIGGQFYYSNSSDSLYGYRMNISGDLGTKRKLTSHHAYYFNEVGNWIYFNYHINDNADCYLYKMKKDGTELQPAT